MARNYHFTKNIPSMTKLKIKGRGNKSTLEENLKKANTLEDLIPYFKKNKISLSHGRFLYSYYNKKNKNERKIKKVSVNTTRSYQKTIDSYDNDKDDNEDFQEIKSNIVCSESKRRMEIKQIFEHLNIKELNKNISKFFIYKLQSGKKNLNLLNIILEKYFYFL